MTSASVLTRHPSHDHHRCCTVGTSDLWIKRQLMCSSPVQKYTPLLFPATLLPTNVTAASRCDLCGSVDIWRSPFPLLFFEPIPKIFQPLHYFRFKLVLKNLSLQWCWPDFLQLFIKLLFWFFYLFDQSFRAPNKSTLRNIQQEQALDHQE